MLESIALRRLASCVTVPETSSSVVGVVVLMPKRPLLSNRPYSDPARLLNLRVSARNPSER